MRFERWMPVYPVPDSLTLTCDGKWLFEWCLH